METDCDQLLSRLTPQLRRLRFTGHGAQTDGGFTPVLNQVYLGMELGSEVSRVNDQCRVARRVSSGCAAWQKLAIVVEEVWFEARKRHRESRRAQTCESANPAAYVAARSEAVAASTSSISWTSVARVPSARHTASYDCETLRHASGRQVKLVCAPNRT